MQTFDQVMEAVRLERQFQDAGLGNAAGRDKLEGFTVAKGLLLVDAYTQKAKAAYATAHPEGVIKALDQLRKVIALGVHTLEENGIVWRDEPGAIDTGDYA